VNVLSLLQNGRMDKSHNKIFSVSVLIGVLLVSLLGGLALVVRSLRNVGLTLVLDLKKDDTGEKKY
jgi:hypothetical protein